MFLAAASMIRSALQSPVTASATKQENGQRISNITLGLGGLAVGLLTGFVGAGGGFLIVPALVSVGKLDMKQAVGTSLFIMAVQSLLGVLGDFGTLVQMDFALFLTLAALALSGMSIGNLLRKRIPPARLKLGFGIFVLTVGCLILFQELTKGSI